MKRIGLLSDTHSFLDEAIFNHFADCDEIWHAGDFGTTEVAEKLQQFKPLRGVYGNIDDYTLRSTFPEQMLFMCEDLKVYMTHIGGYPPKYNKSSLPVIQQEQPGLFISGHSHILKIMFDEKQKCLHMNPGAAGKHGWHIMRTLIKFDITGSKIHNAQVIELGRRSALH